MSKGIKTYLAKKKNMRKNVSSKMQNKRFNRNTKRVGNKKWGGDDDYGDIEEVETGEEKIVGFKLVEKNQKDNTNATDATDATNAIDATDATDAEPTTNIATNKPTAVPTTPPANRFTPGKDDPSKANEEIRAAVNELKEKEKYKNYKTAKNSDKSDVWNKGVIGDWDVSNVTNMSNLFIDFYEFNEPLNAWDVSNVTNMKAMFGGCFTRDADTTDKGMIASMAANFKQELTNLNNIRTHEFSYCMNFNQPLNKWVVSKVTDMGGMFYGCTYFDQDISEWDVSNVTNMNKMFLSCYNFNKQLNAWKVGNVTDMNRMFVNCKKFNQPLDSWKVNPTTDLRFMFANCSYFNQPAIIEKWNLLYMPNENKEYMFVRTPMSNSVIMNKLPTKPDTMPDDDIKADDTIDRVLYYKINPDEIPTACSICGQVIEEGGFAPTKCQNKYHYKCLFDKCNGQAECKCNCGRKLIFPSEQIGLVDEANIGNGYPVEGGKTKRRSKKNQRKTRKSRKNKK